MEEHIELSPDEPRLEAAEAAEATSGGITPRARGSKNTEAATESYVRRCISREAGMVMVGNKIRDHGMATYFLPKTGIDREVITRDIHRYLGNDAVVKPGTHKVSR
jgi:hypothetical protein